MKQNLRIKAIYEWLVRAKKIKNQKDLSIQTGIGQNTLSRIFKDRVEASEETFNKINDAFGGIFDVAFFRGSTSDMFVADDIPAVDKADNSDIQPISQSSLINAMLAAKDETIASLYGQITTKDEVIRAYRTMIQDKDALIESLKAQLQGMRDNYESQLPRITARSPRYRESEPSRHLGVAECGQE
ncbi:MAG: helix-turn-helix transcriptional regulator [Bacteroidaceae bacterium]|nr:helix-turn-helix transcriptional regulator [Bacteroidaceae bacterium]